MPPEVLVKETTDPFDDKIRFAWHAIHGALESDGRLHVVTDHRELFLEEMLPLVEEDERWEKTHEERYLLGYDPPVKSRYQLMWEKHGVLPLRFELKKRQNYGF